VDLHMLRSVLLHVRNQGPAAERRCDETEGIGGLRRTRQECCVKGLAGDPPAYNIPTG